MTDADTRTSPTSTRTSCCRRCTPRSSAARPSGVARGGRARAEAQRRREPGGVGADGRRPHPEAHRRERAPRRHGRAGRRPAVGQRLAEPLLPVGARGPRGVGRERGQPPGRRARRAGARAARRSRARAAAAPRADRRVPRRRGARPRPRRRGDLVVRRRRRAVRPAARAVLGARRRAARRRLPAPVRLQPRRAARPVLPVEHRGPARRERRRAVAPDLRRACSTGIPISRSSPRTAAGTCRPRSDAPTARGRCGPRRDAASTRRRPTCARSGSTRSCTTRTRCARSSRWPADRRSCSAATTRSTWASTIRSRSCAAPGLPAELTERILGGQRRRAARDAGAGMRIARWRDGAETGEGFVIDDRVVPFPDGLTVADVLAQGLDAAHDALRPIVSERCEPERAAWPTCSCSRRSCPRRSATSSRSRSTSRA